MLKHGICGDFSYHTKEISMVLGLGIYIHIYDFPCGSDSKASACNAGDLGSSPGLGDPLEKGMATHSSILAWKIAWTEKTGRLQSMGS